MEETSTKSTFDSVILYTEINNQKWRVQWPSQKVVTNKGAFGHSLHGADKGFYHSESYKNPSEKKIPFHNCVLDDSHLSPPFRPKIDLDKID